MFVFENIYYKKLEKRVHLSGKYQQQKINALKNRESKIACESA